MVSSASSNPHSSCHYIAVTFASATFTGRCTLPRYALLADGPLKCTRVHLARPSSNGVAALGVLPRATLLPLNGDDPSNEALAGSESPAAAPDILAEALRPLPSV